MSKKFEIAGEIAGALATGERSMNQAALDLFAVGTKLFEARNSGHFHLLEGQREVERIGVAVQQLTTALTEVARVHDGLFKKVKEMGTGELCPWPAPTEGHVEEKVVNIGIAA